MLTVGSTRVSAVQGNIVEQRVDVIVNAANTSLLGGGGVDGAIHRAGGPSILEECRAIRARQGRCHPGQAVITGAGNLDAQYVVHTVGPVYQDGTHGEPELLASAYRESLTLANTHGASTIAFPSISTGAYRHPFREATAVALATVTAWVEAHPGALSEVRFVAFTTLDLKLYDEIFGS